MNRALCLILCMLCLAVTAYASISTEGSKISMTPVNVAEFGTPWLLASEDAKPVYAPKINDGSRKTSVEVAAGQILQIEWRQPRDVFSVNVTGSKLPEAGDVTIQYWHSRWPDNGAGGWQLVDDPFNGEWITVKGEVIRSAEGLRCTFSPLTEDECPGIKNSGFSYRRTYKIRMIFNTPATVSELETYTDSTWKEAELKFEWAPRSKNPAIWKGKIEARNAKILSITPAKKPGDPIFVKVRYVDNPHRLSADRGYVIFRNSGWKSFSVFVDDVKAEGGIYVRDIDAFISDASKKLSYAAWKGPANAWDGTIMEKVAKMPEQSMENVAKSIPEKDPREAFFGVPNMRQEFGVSPSGNIQLYGKSLRSDGTDMDRRVWNRDSFEYAVSTLEKPLFTKDGGRKVTRYLENGYMPVVHTEWKTGDIQYKQAGFATMLTDKLLDMEYKGKGDETLVFLDKIELENTGSAEQTANIWMELAVKRPMRIDPDGMMILDAPTDGVARPGLTPVRGWFDINGKGEIAYLQEVTPAGPGSPEGTRKDGVNPRPAVRYSVKLAPGEKHTLFLNVAYIELLNDKEIAALKQVRFDKQYGEVVAYWRERINEGMKYEVPEPILNDLFKTNLWHVIISTDRDTGTGLYHQGAATVVYPNYANETCMVATSLQMRGEHEEAYNLIEPYLVCQGVKPLPGNFKGKDGLMYATHPDPKNDPYTAQGYNMHHGWALWNLAQHYKWTRDAEWLKSAAPSLVAACDWVTRERQATKGMNPDGTKPLEWGLAPAGDLEDVAEYLYWYPTNAYYYAGMKTASEVLAETGHPEAARLKKDAEEYKKDILASMKESLAVSPVVRLKDGTYIPYVPPRTDVVNHLKEGWIREGLYPALHLLDAEVVEPNHPLITWMLQDLEDNIFMSKESGYGVEDQKANFFSLGGFNLQPNLLPNPKAHLLRDEVPHFIRVFYNMGWASLHSDSVCFCEWVPGYGRGAGPMYKTPDESKFIQYMRDMLVFEYGDTLKLGIGVPRAWMTDGKVINIERAATWFGPMDMKITSHVAEGYVKASIKLPTRNPAKSVVLRLRHPDGKKMLKVAINGKDWKKFDASKELITLPSDSNIVDVAAYFRD